MNIVYSKGEKDGYINFELSDRTITEFPIFKIEPARMYAVKCFSESYATNVIVKEEIVAYTDGACHDNDKSKDNSAGSSAYIPSLGFAVYARTPADSEGASSNNRGELYGFYLALKFTPSNLPLRIRTDSQTMMKNITGEFKAKMNLDLVRLVQSLMKDRKVVFEWVKGHTGQKDGNHYADYYAGLGERLPINKIEMEYFGVNKRICPYMEIRRPIKVLPLEYEAEAFYVPDFMPKHEADALFQIARKKIPFHQHEVNVFNKLVQQPRLTAMLGKYDYKYSKNVLKTSGEIPSFLEDVIDRLMVYFPKGTPRFNAVLCNLYLDGGHKIGWHSDDENDMVKDGYIASISIGEVRHFDLRSIADNEKKIRTDLAHGSLIVMGRNVQKHYQHQVPEEKTKKNPRINFTFRVFVDK